MSNRQEREIVEPHPLPPPLQPPLPITPPERKTEFSPESETESSFLNIFNFYSIKNTVNFLREQTQMGLNEKMLFSYLWSEVTRTMGEFAFGEKTARIVYFLKEDGKLYPENLVEPATEIYQRSAVGEREKAELFGFSLIEQMFAQNQANLAFWISPPSPDRPDHGNYGFVFVFVKQDAGLVEEYILRYPEDKQTLEQSLQIYQTIAEKTFSPQNFVRGEGAIFFLTDPQFIKQDQPKQLLTKLIKNLPVETNLLSAFQTEEILKSDPVFQELFLGYQKAINSLVHNPYLSDFKFSQAQSYFTQLYNRAVDLNYRRKMRLLAEQDKQESHIHHFYPPPPPGFGNLDRPPLVFGGGSCPVISSSHSIFSSPISRLTSRLTALFGIVTYPIATLLTPYSYDQEGTCVICGQKKMLGPCKICQECDHRLQNSY